MKKIKLRFIHYLQKNNYSCQKKTFFGWRDVGYTINMGYGSVFNIYVKETKDELIDEVLDKHFKRTRKHTLILEYPGLTYH